MGDSYVQVAVDGSGKKMQTYENTISLQTVKPKPQHDSDGIPVTTREIQDTPVNTDTGILTHAVVYGHTTAGGGATPRSRSLRPALCRRTARALRSRFNCRDGYDRNPQHHGDYKPGGERPRLHFWHRTSIASAQHKNDSSAILYVKLGATASVTDYTVHWLGFYYEIPFSYTGRIDGVWEQILTMAARESRINLIYAISATSYSRTKFQPEREQ
jgi:hypothetical protein